MNKTFKDYLAVSPEVQGALENHQPIVALESTIISHGMPYPQNYQTALEIEELIRSEHAVPATIAIIGGVLKVGLTPEEIEHIAKKGLEVIKTSRRDIPYVVSRHLDGATTVAATCIIASYVGIKIFATGGIGGVHRGAASTFDISNDLEEMARTNVAVVCAGPKAILDLALTLEYLETKGVEVIGYQTDKLPAFYSKASAYKVNHRLDDPQAIAELIDVKLELGLQGGILITNPVPDEFAMSGEVIDAAIDQALERMKNLGVSGKDTTPYLLDQIQKLTQGDSLKSNIGLVKNNARLAARIARCLK